MMKNFVFKHVFMQLVTLLVVNFVGAQTITSSETIETESYYTEDTFDAVAEVNPWFIPSSEVKSSSVSNSLAFLPAPGGISMRHWFKADGGITVDGSNLITGWTDLGTATATTYIYDPNSAITYQGAFLNFNGGLYFTGDDTALAVDDITVPTNTDAITTYAVVQDIDNNNNTYLTIAGFTNQDTGVLVLDGTYSTFANYTHDIYNDTQNLNSAAPCKSSTKSGPI